MHTGIIQKSTYSKFIDGDEGVNRSTRFARVSSAGSLTARIAKWRQDAGGCGVVAVDDAVAPCNSSAFISLELWLDGAGRTALVVVGTGVLVAQGLTLSGAFSSSVWVPADEVAAQSMVDVDSIPSCVADYCE